MNQGTRFAKRCLALLMAAILVATNFSGLAQFVRAEGNDGTDVSFAELVANSYNLTDAEKALLKSEMLASGSITYTAPAAGKGDDLVTAEDGVITVEDYKDANNNVWKPTAAVIEYGDKTLPVTLTDGKGTYSPAVVGNAFAVKVTYTLTTTVSNAEQLRLLGVAAHLKQGLKNLADVAAQGGNLFILEQAMPALVDLAENGYYLAGVIHVAMHADFIEVVDALNGQMTDNGGKLKLSSMIEAYEAGVKTGYLVDGGFAMQAEVAFMANNISKFTAVLKSLIANMEDKDGNKLDYAPAEYAQLKTLFGVCSDLENGLATANADEWYAANNHASILNAGIDYAKLDTLVAALSETNGDKISEAQLKNPLTVATATVQMNKAMWNVTVEVILNTVNGQYGETKTVVLTLADGATKADVLAAIEASNIEATAITSWGSKYVEGKFSATKSELPTTLTKDITYTITYNPNKYNVTIAGETAAYPYGYKLTLPVHADPAKSYDYTRESDSKYFAQGAVVTVEGEMTFTREEGKAYTTKTLYQIIAENYGSDKAAAILNSGALLNDVVINYREPNQTELEGLVQLNGNILTVQSYPSSYKDLEWVPYSYVVDGVTKLFNGATTVDLGDEFMTVNVYYRLVLTNYDEADVKAILDLVDTLVDEANGQKSVMDRLAGYKDQMSQLNKNLLNGLNGMISGYAVSEGGAFSDELVKSVKSIISDIIANSCAANGSLKINGIIDGYTDPNNGGLGYYYQNAAYIKGEISYLSEKLEALLGDPQGKDLLATLLNDMGYSDYVAKLDDLNAKMAQINADLAPVNEAIDTSNAAKLSALAKALASAGSVAYGEIGSPYVQMGPVIRTAARFVTVEIKVTAGGNSETFSITIEKNTALTQQQINEMKTQITAFVNGKIDVAFYNNNYANGAELDALVGVALTAGKNYTYTWTAKEYTVKINGEENQTVTINDLTITLPGHPNAANGMSYEYTVGTKNASAGIYTFTEDELKSLFVNGELTVTRVEKNAAVEGLEKMVADINAAMGFEALILVGENGAYTGIIANVSAESMMNLVMNLVMKSGYSYIGLNGEGFIYSNADGLEISIQTLINAMMNDNGFCSDRLIALGNNGKGTLLTAVMQLGNSAAELQYTALEFTINFTSVPSQMGSVADLLAQLKPYLSFNANNGAMDIEMNLPDKVYGAYLAALLTTGYADKNDMNAVDQKIAFMFLCDYLDAFIETGADLVTLENTIAKLGKEINLSKYNSYFTAGLEYLTYSADNNGLNVNISVPGKSVVDKLMSVLGMGDEQINTFLGMIKEYKANGEIEINAHGLLKNTEKNYNALVLDAQASGIANKFACTTAANLNSVAANLAGASIIILLDDVDGDLHISGKTILDLNGKNVSGNIYAEGSLYIMDSNMDTYGAGSVKSVTGNVSIIAGNYSTDVSAYLKDGYYMDGTTVRNALYHIVADAEGNVTFVINTDVIEDENVDGFLPDVRALALDMVSDLILNYFTTAAMTVDGNAVYNVAFDNLITLLVSSSKVDDIIAKVLNTVDASGISGLTNTIIADLLDFEGIYAALNSDGVVATYNMTVAPWMLGIGVLEGNYLDVSILANTKTENRPGKEKTFDVSLKLEGSNIEYIKKLVKGLAGIVEDDTKVEIEIIQPTYSDKEFNILVNGEAFVNVNLSNNPDYAKILGVILAYGNASKRAAVAEAINNNDMAALKAVVDNTTVAELFTALKAMNRSTNFATMASKVGVTVNMTSAANLEENFHLYLCVVGKALEKLDISGMNAKFGALYNEETGLYVLSGDKFLSGELNLRSYTALYKLNANDVTFQLKLFGDTEHVHAYEAVVTAPTCTEQGYTTYTCACGDSYIADYVDELGHDYKAVVTAPTCTEQGYTTYTCSVCGDSYVEYMDATGHDYKAVVTAPTCTEQGYTTYTCSVCGDSYVDDLVNATGHSFGEWIIIKEPTCVEAGSKQRTCACGETETVVIPAAGSHTVGEWTVVTEATCEENGLEVRFCSVCSEVVETRVIAALGHDWTDATCTECSRCGNCGIEGDPALGHSFGEWIVTKEPTCKEAGIEERVCATCGEVETREIPEIVIWGDVNCDGMVNSFDAALILSYDVRRIDEDDFHYERGDVNGDGLVNSFDAALILSYDVGRIEKFPVEE